MRLCFAQEQSLRTLKGLLRRLRTRGGGVDAETVLATAAALSLYTEAQLAGWVVSPPELRTTAAKALPHSDLDADLLARFYSSQEC